MIPDPVKRSIPAKCETDDLDNAIRVAENVIVPKPKDLEAPGLEPFRPSLIMLIRSSVLSTVDFDNEAFSKTDEIDNIWSDRGLPPEAIAVELFPA